MLPQNNHDASVQEGSYPRWLAVFAAAAGLWVAVVVYLGLTLVQTALCESDFSYLRELPWWMVFMLWATLSLQFGVVLGFVYFGVRLVGFAMRHFRDRIVVTESNILFQSGAQLVRLEWQEVSICRRHLLAVRVFSPAAECWVLPIGKSMVKALEEIESRCVGAQRGRGDAPHRR